ncbi:gamma-glutamyl-gamma-aminobutyrate hydrolase family protein [Stappia sp. MMSF_3263]|uniref:gamma-glutamyl-gamma-aminobutyrate hydrolase family protein n=1 Tax=Stappia sp. MMSF_3263 TaxID=3046693 RepID=UPI00273D38A0|nr:gamma-glutamyl-gamma-aminobutyrate hydrolase family protein [Stappia sp. MMSF_3263]
MTAAPKKPVIGVVARALAVQGRSRPFLGAFEPYLEAISSSGADPVIVPYGVQADTLILFDGVVFTGGDDPSRSEWWDNARPASSQDHRRDAFEADVALLCREHQIPLLAICRGAQLINGVMGGAMTSRADLSNCDHGTDREALHDVQIRPNSILWKALGSREKHMVLSRHSALIARLAPGLDATAWAPDGTIEAFEATEWPCIGVIWHPEWVGPNRAPDLALFQWLVEAARRRQS